MNIKFRGKCRTLEVDNLWHPNGWLVHPCVRRSWSFSMNNWRSENVGSRWFAPQMVKGRHSCFTAWIDSFRTDITRAAKRPTFSLSLHLDLKHFLLFAFCVNFILQTGSHCVAQPGLKLSIPLSQSAKCWDYRCVPRFLVFSLLVFSLLCVLCLVWLQGHLPSQASCFWILSKDILIHHRIFTSSATGKQKEGRSQHNIGRILQCAPPTCWEENQVAAELTALGEVVSSRDEWALNRGCSLCVTTPGVGYWLFCSVAKLCRLQQQPSKKL